MTETYSKSADFGDQLAAGQFHDEIVNDPGITTTLTGVTVDGDVVSVIFVSTISAGEKTALDALVAAHVPAPTNEINVAEGYIELNSSLADNGAIRIFASDPVGGIDIDAGTGGIVIDTTNAISLDAAAESNFTTTSGNLILDATAGLTNIDGGSGINIGTQVETSPVNIGTAAAARTITIGNQTSTTGVTLQTGTNGFNVDVASGGGISIDSTGAAVNWTLDTNSAGQDLTIALTGSTNSSIVLDSQGTGADAIRLNTAGGIDADATGTINLATGSSAGGAITLDAAFNNGGVTISSGSQGIGINSGGGLIGIGHAEGGNIDIGTAAIARTITVGNTTTTTAVSISSGTGGITIGNNANGGEIHIGNVANAKVIIVGNSTGASRLFTRYGTGGLIKSQGAHTALSDSDATLTIGQLLGRLFSITPTVDRTLTLPTAADVVSGIANAEVNDTIQFVIINKSSTSDDAAVTIAMGTGGTAEGHMVVEPVTDAAVSFLESGSGIFELRLTNVTGASEAYTVYRIS